MKDYKSTEQITLVYNMMCCLNFIILVFICGVIALSLQEIVNMNIARDFLETLSIMPMTPPFKCLFLAIIGFVLFLFLHFISMNKKLANYQLAFLFLSEIIISIFIMYCMGFSSNAIVLLFIGSVLISESSLEFRIPFLLLGIVVFILFNEGIFSQLPVVGLSDFYSIYNTKMQILLQITDSTLNAFNIIVFVILMFLVVYKEVKTGKEMRKMNHDLKVLNEQLKEYAILQEKMGETKERNRLAREIHDTLGHTLTGLSVGIDAAIMVLNIDTEATRKQLSLLSESARRGLQDVRRSVEKLRPDALERYSLKEAIDKMISDFISISNVNISFKAHMEVFDFDPDIEEFIYRFVQEGTTNAVRHGKAKNILVSFAIIDHVLVLAIEDDGIGCKKVNYGFGLHHMQERLAQFNGTLRIYNEQHFMMIAEIPLRKERYD